MGDTVPNCALKEWINPSDAFRVVRFAMELCDASSMNIFVLL